MSLVPDQGRPVSWTRDERRAAVGTLRAALDTVVAASAVPYGYTLAIWGSGALLVRAHGAPSTAEAFVFAAGGIAGFFLTDQLLDLLAAEAPGPMKPTDRRQDRVLAGLFDWVAVGAALGAVSLLGDIPGWLPWLAGPLAATALYLLIVSVQLAAVAGRHSAAVAPARRPPQGHRSHRVVRDGD